MVNWSTTAFVFPGQGSQTVGMSQDIAEAYPVARELFEQADEILGFSLSNLCFNGPEDELNDTINTQPALFVSGMATLRALQNELPDAKPVFVAGHSLGEFTALAAAGAISFEDGLKLVRERGRLMKEAGTRSPGAMAALLGLDADAVRSLVAQVSEATGKTLVLANDNCPGQIVISGDNAALDTGLEAAKEAGARRAVKLAVSIAAHSPLMESVASEFREALAAANFSTPDVPVYGNVNAAPLSDVAAIRQELDAQLTQSVRWTESVQAMIVAGAEQFIELGPGDVLTGLLRRIDRSKKGIPLNSVDAIHSLTQADN
ncbi:MAG: [acyl-carrier-protein] S-malonyltransferase [Chloroflexi bacterium]|nr:MAG: [acyl-carrier-protein] S-malonyltransferase [Phototrophicales bacterium]RMF76563.1 MAG: [acyl-carrier-protein] S-malonyltransferase [Chloroflexota bacterium]